MNHSPPSTDPAPPTMSHEPEAGGPAWRDLAALTIAAALAAGYLDRVSLVLRSVIVEPLIFVGRHAWWTAPIANLLLFAVVMLGLAVLAAVLRGQRHLWTVSIWTFAFLAGFGALYSFPQVQRVAALVLSAGIATVVTRRIGTPTATRLKTIRWAAAGLVLATTTVAAVSLSRDWLRERRSIATTSARDGAPNILLIVLDTVRAINLSLYGYHRETTPNLTRWAAKGIAFTRAYSTAPWTLPSHASMMTGRWMHEMSTDWMVPLDQSDPTLAEALGRRGYRTAGFVANTDYCSTEVGLDRGFARFEDYTLDLGQVLRSSSLWRAGARLQSIRRILGNYDNLGRRTAPEISERFLRWLATDRNQPFFAFLNYYDAHRPYFPPAEWTSRFRTPGIPLNPRYRKEDGDNRQPAEAQIQGAIDAYDNAIGYLDSEIGKLLDQLERQGVLENTAVIITSDHGEEFFERGLWDHGNSLYHPSVHVPLLVIAPGRVAAGLRLDTPVSLRSIPATAAEWAGLEATSFPGQPLSRAWTQTWSPDTLLIGVRQVPRQPFWYPVTKGSLGSIIAGETQYIRNLGDGTEELFEVKENGHRTEALTADSAAQAGLRAFRALVGPMFPRQP